MRQHLSFRERFRRGNAEEQKAISRINRKRHGQRRGKTPATYLSRLFQQYRHDIEVVGDVFDEVTRFGMEVNGVRSRIQWRDRDI
jgi:hypothetical protein